MAHGRFTAQLALIAITGSLLAMWPGLLQPPASPRLHRWVDAGGIVHYSDAAAARGRADVSTDPAAVARTAELTLHEDDGRYVAMVRNLLAGPVQIELGIREHDNVSAFPRLPHRMLLEAGEQRSAAALEKINPDRPGRFELHLLAMPGAPDATHGSTEYRMPVAIGPESIMQGFGGAFSHSDAQNFHAIDFALAEGSPVLAARDGIAMQVVVDHTETGLDRDAYVNRANHIRILHDDGSMAVYAHLMPGGSRVRAGERVQAGQHIADSGNTGFSSGPHLHFVVQVNRGMALESVPVRLFGPDGEVAIPGAASP